MADADKTLARRYLDMWNQGNMAVLREIIAPDCVHYDPALPEVIRGPEAFEQIVQMYRTAFPDLAFTLEDAIAEGDRVAFRWRARGTQRGELMGIPPTGITGEVTGMEFLRVAGGQIVEDWTNWDALGLLQQLGAVPKPGQAAASA